VPKKSQTVTLSVINMKGGVGKTTLAFNFAWYSAWQANLRVLAVDLDPQANLSQYFMGAEGYLEYLQSGRPTIVEVFEQFSAPSSRHGAPTRLVPGEVVNTLHEWNDGSLIHLIPSRLELAWTLKNPTEKAHLLPRFLAGLRNSYDLIIIDCAPTESILTTAAYLSSRYIVVPVKPEFLATIGLPLLARSLDEFRLMHQNQRIDLAGILFNDARRNASHEQAQAYRDVGQLAAKRRWKVFENAAHHSDSYSAGSRAGVPIFRTKHARDYVRGEFHRLGKEVLNVIGLNRQN
jgi:chromosome partitioning protein